MLNSLLKTRSLHGALMALALGLMGTFTANACPPPISEPIPAKLQPELSIVPESRQGFPTPQERNQVLQWLAKTNRNLYGDQGEMTYAGGTPLFDEGSGQYIDLYPYLVQKFPNKPWRATRR